jgi:hypothetical protein
MFGSWLLFYRFELGPPDDGNSIICLSLDRYEINQLICLDPACLKAGDYGVCSLLEHPQSQIPKTEDM